MTSSKRWVIGLACWLLLTLWFHSPALAEEARDITFSCTFRMGGGPVGAHPAFDRKYTTAWNRYGQGISVIEISLPDGVRQGGLYLCFSVEPAALSVSCGQELEPFYREAGPGFAHRYIPFEEKSALRLELQGAQQGMGLSELFVFEGEQPPPWVQRWQPALEKADLLVLVAHPDDELLWFGGAIPYYALARGMDIAVATMTCANPLRRSEALNALWAAGIRHYPRLGTFRDRRMPSLKQSYQLWGGEDKVVDHITGLFRQLKPQVVLSHDLQGEYGHPAHVITARGVQQALEASPNPECHPVSAERYGTWDVPKAYLHLYPEGAVLMAWQQPIAAYEGLTSLEVSQLAFHQYRSQAANWAVSVEGPHSAARFGLYRSMVGEDTDREDFFENLSMPQVGDEREERHPDR